MATEVVMLRFTHEMEEGTIARWLKAEGDDVRQGEPLFDVITDKVNVEVEAPATGVLRRILVAAEQPVRVGTTVAWIGTADEPLPEVAAPAASAAHAAPPEPRPAPRGAESREHPSDDPRAGGRVVASPVAQRLAREKGVDLAHVTGTGPRGRITEADVLRFAGAAAAAPADELIPLSRLRKTISERMSRSAQTIPHFTLTVDADMTEALGWREQRADVDGRKPSVTALLVKAAADALRRFPQVNASLTDQGIRRHAHINVGVAVASDEGLVVPVVRDADGKAPSDISAELSRLQGKARALRFEAHEITGATFTITNLGMFGIDSFLAIINPPEAAILAAGRIAERPVGLGGQVVLRPMMTLTLAVDHRVLDGASAAPFLTEVKKLLESPNLLT
jgi:pyruvate dehydrogenase E2 component (dihydrolipoamide acetyltransferase)